MVALGQDEERGRYGLLDGHVQGDILLWWWQCINSCWMTLVRKYIVGTRAGLGRTLMLL